MKNTIEEMEKTMDVPFYNSVTIEELKSLFEEYKKAVLHEDASNTDAFTCMVAHINTLKIRSKIALHMGYPLDEIKQCLMVDQTS